jgi:hypothetical protein
MRVVGPEGGAAPDRARAASAAADTPRMTPDADRTTADPRFGPASGDATTALCEVDLVVNGAVVESVQLVEGRHAVGRDTRCRVRVADPSVSSRHAEIVVARGHVTVQDTRSTNGTLVGAVPADAPMVLHDGDVVALSRSVSLRVVRGGNRRAAA